MKYSIKGNLNLSDGSNVIALFNTFTLWRLYADNTTDRRTQEQKFTFEVWVNTEAEKTALFNALKPFVDQYGEEIKWHECTHDEPIHTPCVPVEIYTGGE